MSARRDVALLFMGFAGAHRRSELVALTLDGQPAPPVSGNTGPVTPAGHSLRTLLVEDNRVDARLTQEGLRDCDNGIDCDIATSLREVSAQRLATVDCAVVDLGLPDASGLQAVDRIHDLAPHLPIVVLTGLDDAATGPRRYATARRTTW